MAAGFMLIPFTGVTSGWAGIILLSLRTTGSAEWLRPKAFALRARQSNQDSHPCVIVLSTQRFQKRVRLVEYSSDGQGFEPWVPVRAHTLSKRAQSTTLPPIQTTKC